jgi:hypothetical protein
VRRGVPRSGATAGRGMDVLFEARMPDIMGGAMRICWEQWVTGM